MRLALLLAAAALGLVAQPPQVLVIGDSISIGYTPFVTKLLADKATVSHNPENAAHSNNGVEKLESWLGAEKWKVITFNFGLHDLKIMDGGVHQVPLPQYEKNLETIATRLHKTGARVIFVNTTPVPEGKLSPLRKPGDELAFNQAAVRIMKKHHIPVVDLHKVVTASAETIQLPANVHFTPAGYSALAEVVAKAIEEQLHK